MKPRLFTRRRAITAGAAAAAGGLVLTRHPAELPPTYGHLLRMGDALTYAAHRVLLPDQALVPEYGEADVTSFPALGADPATRPHLPLADAYRQVRDGGFTDWRLSVEGRVATPRTFSLAELRQLPSRTQITRHTCEEGWSAIGKWTGVPLGLVLEAAGIMASARYVKFESYDDWADNIDLLEAFHPQTLLAYGMNGQDLPIAHGAPLRLRVERQLGYKNMKFLHRIIVTNEFDDGGAKGNIQNGWAWYTGI